MSAYDHVSGMTGSTTVGIAVVSVSVPTFKPKLLPSMQLVMTTKPATWSLTLPNISFSGSSAVTLSADFGDAANFLRFETVGGQS